jgi:hypothetical protein
VAIREQHSRAPRLQLPDDGQKEIIEGPPAEVECAWVLRVCVLTPARPSRQAPPLGCDRLQTGGDGGSDAGVSVGSATRVARVPGADNDDPATEVLGPRPAAFAVAPCSRFASRLASRRGSRRGATAFAETASRAAPRGGTPGARPGRSRGGTLEPVVLGRRPARRAAASRLLPPGLQGHSTAGNHRGSTAASRPTQTSTAAPPAPGRRPLRQGGPATAGGAARRPPPARSGRRNEWCSCGGSCQWPVTSGQYDYRLGTANWQLVTGD